MMRFFLLSAGLMLAPSAQAGEADRCLAVATMALRAASAAEAGISLPDFAATVPDPSRTATGIILVAYGLYIIGGDAPRMIAAEIYDGCMGEDA
ncbi:MULTISPECIES: hypothetical protein [Haematobacter]|uniref:Uncharacterized protein n=1 Tax=Haematobacter massiliensis TaxID=195105 RepID=A0A086Y8U3_9RHOB|nr:MULTISPECIES: hypothetical protein [Haematobacter]KFI30693.1 hypothetical protein CN97_12825 [Haematobacter massiliensis]OWJ70913.1 hypothetical protein CDV50_11300 [Haematobacter massiliensis]OWJ87454.1 hypothetical protein CDV51_06920 [Haematobacter massiliensis]QBJ24907.1 hypothetical protein HmaOT1_12025 [Haematobacter massiliensis]